MTQSLATIAGTTPLLAPDEPPAAKLINPDGSAPLLLVCDHASRRVPRALDGLGLSAEMFARHIAWDIGAADVALSLAERFDATLVMCNYSRLVIDCNRDLDDPTSILAVSDGVPVPGNAELSDDDIQARADAIFNPYHQTIADQVDRKQSGGKTPALVSIHSFTPVFGGFRRPWDIGVLWNQDPRLAEPFMTALRRSPGVEVGDNEPYSARENYGHTVAKHGESRALPHLLVEIRQDLIDTPAGISDWARRAGDALTHAMHSLETPL